MVRRTLLLVGAVLLVAVAPAFADWDPTMPTKWVQMPDETDLGIDVDASYDLILADDFLCTEPGPITQIHIWGSWLNDMLPPNGPEGVMFTLSIHADIPQGPGGYSIPGEPLWVMTFQPGDFTARVWLEGTAEGWLEPPDVYMPAADFTIWQYNFYIPEQDQFYQEGSVTDPVIYWLDVKAEPLDGVSQFGWKTSVEHWNDDAVWGLGIEPFGGPWEDLHYPPYHPYAGQSIDLAFALVGQEQELDWGDAPDPTYPTLAISNGANHVIGGPWLGDASDGPDAEIDGQPEASALGDDTFDLNDDEDGVQIPVLTQGTTSTITVEVSGGGGDLGAWIDFDGDGTWAASEMIYGGPLPDGLNNINVNTPINAVVGQTFARFRISSTAGLSPIGAASDGEVEDYEVRIAQAEVYKWDQPPDLSEFGIDVDATDPYVLADDFLCTEPGRISEIRVWGSWLYDYLPLADPNAVTFFLSIHADIPADENPEGYSIPGDILWGRTFIAGEFDVEPYAQNLEEGWMDPPDMYVWPGDTICWLYRFYVPIDEAFFQWGTEVEPVIYWLDVQAYSHDQDARFGWKTSEDHWNDDAVWGQGSEPYPGPWYELIYPPAHPYFPHSIDLAFRLISDPMSGVPERTEKDGFGLCPNEPNPFKGATTIRYNMAVSGLARLEVFNVMGQVVNTLVDANQAAGPHTAAWSGLDNDGHQLPAGVYFCRLTVGRDVATQKMMYLK